MNRARFQSLTGAYPKLRVAVMGDFCLDRYLEIDPAREEISIETGLPVHNVVNVRSQPGGAGTILNNLAALGIGRLYPVGFCGEDGEGFELQRALKALPGVDLGCFLQTTQRRTFTYCKPLVLAPGAAPVELSRLDSKNWTPTPVAVEQAVVARLTKLVANVGGMMLLDQVSIQDTGVLTGRVLQGLTELLKVRPSLPVLADSRRSLEGFPPVMLKMNAAELAAFTREALVTEPAAVKRSALALAREKRRNVFITLAEQGIVAATPEDQVMHFPALPLRGPIDVVGAGDAVSANLLASIAAGASVSEALEIAAAAASVVLHKLGTTGTASLSEIEELLWPEAGQAGESGSPRAM